MNPTEKVILNYLGCALCAVSATDIAEFLELPADEVQTAVRCLTVRGLLERDPDGKFKVVERL